MNKENGTGFQPDIDKNISPENVETKNEKVKLLGARVNFGKEVIAEKLGLKGFETWKNQDRVFRDRVIAVYDGAGGNGSGDTASGLTLDITKELNQQIEEGRIETEDIPKALETTLEKAHERLYKTGSKMATTAALGYIDESKDGKRTLYVSESGDSPVIILNRATGKIQFLNKGLTQKALFAISMKLGRPLDTNDPDLLRESESLNNTLAEYQKINDAPPEIRGLYSGQSAIVDCIGGGNKEPSIRTYSQELNPKDMVAMGSDGLFNNLTTGEIRQILTETENLTPQKFLELLTEKALGNIRLARENPGIYTYKGIDDISGLVIGAKEAFDAKYVKPATQPEQNNYRQEDSFDPDGKNKGKTKEIEVAENPEQEKLIAQKSVDSIIETTTQAVSPENKTPELNSQIQSKLLKKTIFGKNIISAFNEFGTDLKGATLTKLTNRAVAGVKNSSLFKNTAEKIGALRSRLFTEPTERRQEELKTEEKIQSGEYWENKIDTWATNFESWRERKGAELIQKLVSSRSSTARLEQEMQKNKESGFSLNTILKKLDKIQESVDLASWIQKENIEKKSGLEKLEALCNQLKTSQLEEMKKYCKEAAQVFNKLEQGAKTGLLSFKKVAKSFATAAVIVGVVGFAGYEGSQHLQKQYKAPEVVSFTQTFEGEKNQTPEAKALEEGAITTPEKTAIQTENIKEIKIQGNPWNTVKTWLAKHNVTNPEKINEIVRKVTEDNKIDIFGETRRPGFILDTNLKSDRTLDLSKAAEAIGLTIAESPKDTIQETSKNTVEQKTSGLMTLATTPFSTLRTWFKG